MQSENGGRLISILWNIILYIEIILFVMVK